MRDGRYSIDNTIAERFIRPLAGEQKNSLLFWQQPHGECVSRLSYFDIYLPGHRYIRPGLFKDFFREVVKGRKDYENLLPMNIGINTNKLKNQVQFLKTLRGKTPKWAFPMGYVKIGRLLLVWIV